MDSAAHALFRQLLRNKRLRQRLQQPIVKAARSQVGDRPQGL